MSAFPFEITTGASDADCEELAWHLSPLEFAAAGLPMDDLRVPDMLCRVFKSERAAARTYVARVDGELAGICFVYDFPDRREMSFAKTRYLTEQRKVAFARGIPQLLRELARREAQAGCGAPAMYMHVPEGDDRSKEWFIRCGCAETDKGLLCPAAGEEVCHGG